MDAGDLDFQMPCRYFKSSFARSLSLNSNSNNNGNVALALPKKPQTTIEANKQQQQQHQHQQQQQQQKELEVELMMNETHAGGVKELVSESFSCLTPPPPALPARRHTINNSSSSSNNNNNNNNNLIHFKPTTTNQLPPSSSSSSPTSLSSPSHPVAPVPQQRNLNLVWPLQDANNIGNGCGAPIYGHHQQQQQQQLQQQQHHLQLQQQQQQQQHPPQLNVEAVILQNQVDSLQWQLKQTETNCEMYRAVMEEVARFFERYQQQQQNYRNFVASIGEQQQLQHQQQQQQQQQISRSKSLHHVQGVGTGQSNNCSMQIDGHLDGGGGIGGGGGGVGGISERNGSTDAAYLRARSSTNLMLNKSMLTMNDEHNYQSIAPAGSYNAFKDFTWRRSPKKQGGGCKARLSSPEAEGEKLNQEAFRLARTIRNLLHTNQQQTDLMQQSRHSLASSSIGSQHHYRKMPMHNSTAIMMDTTNSSETVAKTNTAAEMLFLRANNIRDSRLSLRSSTDSSVHSTISSTASSSSKIETDDETTTITTNNKSNIATGINSPTITHTSTAIIKQTNVNHHGSSTEDESGFSSISSFHDIGLPLSSTLIAVDEKQQQRRLSLSNTNTESRNSTLKSSLNGIGLPPPISSSISSSNSNSSSKTTYRNAASNRYQRFSTLSNEDPTAVLWV